MQKLFSQSSSADFFIMRILYESSLGLQPYTLLKRSKLSGEVFFKVFSSLVSKHLIYERNSLIFLSDSGREIFLPSAGRVIGGSEKSWRAVPETMLGYKLSCEDFYIPNIDLLD